MDTLGPVIRLGPWPRIAPENWRRDTAAGVACWQHRRTRAVYQVRREGEELAARLAHVCDGAPVPDREAQAWYGGAAILLEALHSGAVGPEWPEIVGPDEDGPPAPLPVAEDAELRAVEAEWAEADRQTLARVERQWREVEP